MGWKFLKNIIAKNGGKKNCRFRLKMLLGYAENSFTKIGFQENCKSPNRALCAKARLFSY
jgi:hypothetical protein